MFLKSRYLLWHVVNRSLWLMRSNILFQGYTFDMCAILDLIKVCSGKWFVSLMGETGWSFSDWGFNPIAFKKLGNKPALP